VVLVPVASPDHPPNEDNESGVAVNVTLVPDENWYEHVDPQLIPDGDDETVPPPLPDFVTVRVYDDILNVAVTLLFELIVIVVVVLVPVASPDHPPNVEDESGVAVNVTLVPDENWYEHVDPQLIPDGDDEIVPVPVPDFVTVRVYDILLNVAVTLLLEFIVTVVVVLVPTASPDHPLNVEDESVVAVNVTLVPDAN
jgi:hypothetical protein